MPTRKYAQQKAALTRALKTGDTTRVVEECRRVKTEWEETGWPDDWSRWQRALDDVGAFENIEEV